jgi:hypothetical protein
VQLQLDLVYQGRLAITIETRLDLHRAPEWANAGRAPAPLLQDAGGADAAAAAIAATVPESSTGDLLLLAGRDE